MLASAQGGNGPIPGVGVREHLQKEIAAKQRAMRSGRLVRSSVRVKVRLRNGHRLEGVVKNGRFIERVDGLAFVPADLQTSGAGIRLFYYDNTTSYIFLPYQDVANYRIGSQLTDQEIKAIEDRIRRAEERARDRRTAKRSKQDAARKAGRPAEPVSGAEEKSTEATKAASTDGPALTEKQQKLLVEFPSAEGWGSDRIREIEFRRITLGQFPTDRDKRFVDNFEDWVKASTLVRQFEAKKKADAAKANAGKGGSGSATSRPTGNSRVAPARSYSATGYR